MMNDLFSQIVFCYATIKDDTYDLPLRRFREALERAYRSSCGMETFVFFDHNDLKPGQIKKDCIDEALRKAPVLIAVLTPAFFKDEYCRDILNHFLKIERLLNRKGQIIPIYYQNDRDFTKAIEQPSGNQFSDNEVIKALVGREYVDWREFRQKSMTDPECVKELERIAERILDLMDELKQPEKEGFYPSSSRSEQDEPTEEKDELRFGNIGFYGLQRIVEEDKKFIEKFRGTDKHTDVLMGNASKYAQLLTSILFKLYILYADRILAPFNTHFDEPIVSNLQHYSAQLSLETIVSFLVKPADIQEEENRQAADFQEEEEEENRQATDFGLYGLININEEIKEDLSKRTGRANIFGKDSAALLLGIVELQRQMNEEIVDSEIIEQFIETMSRFVDQCKDTTPRLIFPIYHCENVRGRRCIAYIDEEALDNEGKIDESYLVCEGKQINLARCQNLFFIAAPAIFRPYEGAYLLNHRREIICDPEMYYISDL